MEVLAVIPARGGSVRVPKKNIKMLNGKPLLAYAIEAAKESEYVTKIVVSTDDSEIMNVALDYNALIFNRPKHLSGDCPTEDVVLDVVGRLEVKPDIVVCLEPPQPFRTAKHIDNCVRLLYYPPDDIDSAVTVHKVTSRPEWMVRFPSKFDYIEPYTDYFKSQGDALLRFPASQEFEELYYVNGIVFACKTETLLKYKSMVGKRCIGVITDREDSFDLNYPEDFEICEMIMERRGNDTTN